MEKLFYFIFRWKVRLMDILDCRLFQQKRWLQQQQQQKYIYFTFCCAKAFLRQLSPDIYSMATQIPLSRKKEYKSILISIKFYS